MTSMAIGQIIYRMHQQRGGYYGIAVPDTSLFRQELSKIPIWIKQSLKLNIFLINARGQIKKITPAKAIQ